MKKLDEYFKNFTDRLAYIDLKDSSKYPMLSGTSLPIYIEDIKEGIKSGDFAKEINLKLILKAMLINIAIDPEFIYRDKYEEILSYYLKDIASYTKDLSISLDGKEALKALLYSRAGYLIEPDNLQNSYVYARLLWPKAFSEANEYKDEFVKESLKILQESIAKDENFSLAYFELGNIYSNLGEYIKANSYYKNALSRVEDEIAKEEIRARQKSIEDEALIEEALYQIGKSNYNKSVSILTKVLSKNKRADAYYYLAVAYQNLGQYENSILAFRNSLDMGADFRELYNDYSISLYLNNEELKALEIINQGLLKYPQDPRMTYNKVQINLKLGNIKKAKEDIDELLTYDDLTAEIRNNLNILKDLYKLN